jgi:hypothetical protein
MHQFLLRLKSLVQLLVLTVSRTIMVLAHASSSEVRDAVRSSSGSSWKENVEDARQSREYFERDVRLR